jgi:protein ImuB
VDRTACVDLPAFALQLLLRRHPEWRSRPAAVVDVDKPQGVVLQLNERARAARILPGMRYAAALSLCRELHAAEVTRKEIERATVAVAKQLRQFTPEVEPAADEPGVFWLNAAGLERLYGSLGEWVRRVRGGLERAGLNATVVAGFSRFGSYAAAKAKRGVIVFKTPDDERAAARRVPLERLNLEPKVRDALAKLGVQTVGRFADLPADGFARRFGAEAARVHRLATGELQLPLQPQRPAPPALRRQILDHPETDVERLNHVIEQLIQPTLQILADRCEALAELHVGFRFEKLGDHVECVRPASPTLDARQLFELVRLRLEALRRLPDPVVEVVLAGKGKPTERGQLQLFAQRPKRDLRAAERALARIRAALGDDAVRRARLRDGHLPEGRFTWDSLDKLTIPRPREVDTHTLIRRIYDPPVPLPARPRHEPDGWMLLDLKQGHVIRTLGPYVISGGWWNRSVHREYHYTETRNGELLWVYYDRPRRRWYLQGRVE